jgi:predicted DNA-binding transcriptional regulator YafY
MHDRHEIIIGALKCGMKRSTDLMAMTQASERTIYRDIARLRKAGFSIRGEAGVGFMLQEERHG